ncbi:membrane protein insertase YidC [Vibrio sp.]|uniref:Membrane protein insertase YidC n=1 Tax=Vibrio viridaestus TaxID=2487322 RepID=A0A3N9U0R2_9VIBR|nr:membrane protein insertase YidC [Vibrio viridaestus]MDC0610908.1 membrane protein insertase YidC [Vibrio sp.]RQW61246.1 membrane protein insertase YidC [Vibrio viridaestus]
MDSQRNILLIALALVSFLLFQQWQVAKNPAPEAVEQTQTDSSAPASNGSVELASPATAQQAAGKIITIDTDVLAVKINTVGGDVVSAKLKKYDETLNSDNPFVLLKDTKDHQFIAQSGLIGPQGVDRSNGRPTYLVAQDQYTLTQGQDELSVPFTYQANGITYTKTFVFKRNSYAIDMDYKVDNQSGQNAEVGMYAHLRQTLLESTGSLAMPTYRGGAFSTEDTRYKKFSFDDMQEHNLNETLTNGQGWAAMIQHYFAVAWIPRSAPETKLFSRVVGDSGDIGIQEPNKTIANGQTATFDATLWVGPKLQDQMAATAPNLDLVVDYGWLWFIAKPLHSLLSFLQSFIGNWGFSIICLTFIVRGAMYPLTKAQYTSMAKMRMLQPKIQAMKERIGDDRQRMSQEMMALYKEEKVNPLGGCLPIVLQMPIFISLYWALMESVELRHSPFILWIHDLSAQDPYFILPILMGASMFMIQKMSPTTVTDPMQQKIMMFMPVAFSVFFFFFPSGLVLYYFVSNVVTLVQQTLIYKSLEKKGLHTKVKK